MKYRVIFDVFRQRDLFNKDVEEKAVEVEANNVKMATLKAMAAINKIEGYGDLYKNIKRVEEIDNGN